MPAERLAAFLRGEPGASFEELALEVFRLHYERSPPFRAFCDERGATPGALTDWRDVPAVPVAALEAMTPAVPAAPPVAVDEVVGRCFPGGFLEGMGRPPMLSLVPAGEDPVGWILLAEHLLAGRAAPDGSLRAAGRTVEVAKTRSFLAARQRDRRPTLLLGTSATLERLLEALERRGLRFRLPPGSGVIEAGGRGPARELLSRLAAALDVPADRVLRAYGVAGLASHFYAGFRRDGEPRPFLPPPWTRARVLAPDTLAEAPPGARGRLAIFDLAAPGPAPQALTEDQATAGDAGFRLAPASS